MSDCKTFGNKNKVLHVRPNQVLRHILLACMTSLTLTWMMSEVIMIKSPVALITKIGSFYKTSVRCANVIVTNLRVAVLLEQEADNMGCFWAYKYHH